MKDSYTDADLEYEKKLENQFYKRVEEEGRSGDKLYYLQELITDALNHLQSDDNSEVLNFVYNNIDFNSIEADLEKILQELDYLRNRRNK